MVTGSKAETALLTAAAADGRWHDDQEVLAYVTRPASPIDHRALAEVRSGKEHGT